MDWINILGYSGAMLLVIYISIRFFQQHVLKQKVTMGYFDIVTFLISLLLTFAYVILRKDYPLIIVYVVFLFWALSSFTAKNKQKK